MDDAAEPAPAVRFLDEEADGALFMNAEDTWGGGGTKALLKGAAAAEASEGAEAGEEEGEGEDLADALKRLAVERDQEDDEDGLYHWSVMQQVVFALHQSSIRFVSASVTSVEEASAAHVHSAVAGLAAQVLGTVPGGARWQGSCSAVLELFSSTAFGDLVLNG